MILIVIGWLMLCAIITTFITSSFIAPENLFVLVVLFLSPFLLRPLSCLMLRFRKPLFVIKKKPGCIWLHLNPWVSTRQLGVREISQFWFSLITTLKSSLAQSSQPIIMSSHLLGSKRIAKLRRHFPVKRYRFHFIKRPIGRAEHIGLQLEILIKEWRWFTPSTQGGIVVICRRKNDVLGERSRLNGRTPPIQDG
ncbi:putative membrane protein [Yersinia enterocolitica subsp. enterocolitica 8081]|uniref:Membrane protein n=2 Tax=Yersinia enterocolitica TaxID=630 RepID=A1JPX7_YERE8|nr:putative membrane protein [Yersinia enterocolitica subsp. enterocolitica 8081]